jgi:hypothetical protein
VAFASDQSRNVEGTTLNLFVRNDTTARARASWSKSIGHLLSEIDRPQPLLRSMRPLDRRDVAIACAPALTEIRRVLDDSSAPVRPEAMRRLRDFLTDGAGSPLYRDDPEVARRVAHEIASAFVVPAATRDATASQAAEAKEARPATAAASRTPRTA